MRKMGRKTESAVSKSAETEAMPEKRTLRRRLSVPDWSGLFKRKVTKKSPKKNAEKATTSAIKHEKQPERTSGISKSGKKVEITVNKAKEAELSNAKKVAVEKIMKQQQASSPVEHKKPNKIGLKDKISKTLKFSMSTPVKETPTKRLENSDSEIISPIVKNEVNHDVSPTKKQKISPVQAKEIHPKVKQPEEMKRKEPRLLLPPVAARKQPPPTSFQNAFVKETPTKPLENSDSEIINSAVQAKEIHPKVEQPEELKHKKPRLLLPPVAARPQRPGPAPTSFQNAFVEEMTSKFPVASGSRLSTPQKGPPKKKNELNSLNKNNTEDQLDTSDSFYGFSDEDIPLNLSEIETMFLNNEENVKDGLKPLVVADLCPIPLDRSPPVAKTAPTVIKKIIVQRVAPISTPPKPMKATVPVRCNSMMNIPTQERSIETGNVNVYVMPSHPLKEVQNYKNQITFAPPMKTLANKEVQTDPIQREINSNYLIGGEPPGTKLYSGFIKVGLDPTTKAPTYELINLQLNSLSVVQSHSVQLQLRHQIVSYEIFNQPKDGDYFPIQLIVNPNPEETEIDNVHQRQILYDDY